MGVFGIFGRVIVEGTSMQPTYNPLDWLLVHYGFFGKKYLFLSPGNVVVVERETQPGIFYVKRIAEIAIEHSGEKKGKKSYYVLSDNEAGTDSRKWGLLSEAEVIGKVITRIKRN
jgi:signal peptidase I